MNKSKITPLATILVSSSLASCLAGVSLNSCAKQENKSLYVVEAGVLKGFNDKLSFDEIKNQVGDAIVIPKHVKEIGKNAFFSKGKTTIPSSVKNIDFSQCSLEKIGENAFLQSPFSKIVFPNCLTEIQANAFSQSELTEVVFTKPNNNSRLTIGANAFDGCSKLSKLTFNSLITDVKDDAFANLPSLNYIDVIEWTSKPEWNGVNIFDKSLSEQCSIYSTNENIANQWINYIKKSNINPTQFKIVSTKTIFDISEDGILNGWGEASPETIGAELVIPSNVKEIKENAFYDEKNDSTTIPTSITKLSFASNNQCTKINANAFKCAPFSEMVFPQTIAIIGSDAFAELSRATLINIEEFDKIPSTWEKNAFSLSWDVQLNDSKILIKFEWEKQKVKDYFDFSSIIWEYWTIEAKTTLLKITGSIETKDRTLNGFTDGITPDQIKDAFIYFGNKLVIPDEIFIISDKAFVEEKDGQFISRIPDSVIELNFANNYSKTEVIIGEYAFYNAPFTKVTLPTLPKQIKQYAFAKMTKLTAIESGYVDMKKFACPADEKIWGTEHAENGKILEYLFWTIDHKLQMEKWFEDSGFKTVIENETWSFAYWE